MPMRLVQKAGFLALALGVATPVDAQTTRRFVATNSMTVVQESSDTFSVLFESGFGDADYWCAVGEFVTVAGRLSNSTRIFRLSEPPRRQGQGIRFSLNGEGAASRTGLSTFGGQGPTNSISAGHARSVCTRVFPRLGMF